MLKKALRIFFIPFEFLFQRVSSLGKIPDSNVQILLIRIKKYKGPKITLKDGTVIDKRDKVGEFHLNNIAMLDSDNSLRNISRLLNSELFSLTKALTNSDDYRGVKGFYCITILYPITEWQGHGGLRYER